MLIETLLLSSLTAIGIKKYCRRRQARRELNDSRPRQPMFFYFYQKSKTRLQAVKKKLIVSLSGGEVRYQRFKYHQRFKSMLVKKDGNQAEIDKNINLSLGMAGLALMGTWLYSPLLLIATIGTVYLLYPLYQKLFQELQKGRISPELFEVISIVALLMMGYIFWATCVTFISLLNLKLSEEVEHHSLIRTIKVFTHPQQSVWVMRTGTEMETPLRAVKKRDIVVVNAGEIIQVDGVITQGSANIDQHKLTGELQPVEKKVGEKVFATTLVLDGRLLIRVTNTGANTTAAKMGHIAI